MRRCPARRPRASSLNRGSSARQSWSSRWPGRSAKSASSEPLVQPPAAFSPSRRELPRPRRRRTRRPASRASPCPATGSGRGCRARSGGRTRWPASRSGSPDTSSTMLSSAPPDRSMMRTRHPPSGANRSLMMWLLIAGNLGMPQAGRNPAGIARQNAFALKPAPVCFVVDRHVYSHGDQNEIRTCGTCSDDGTCGRCPGPGRDPGTRLRATAWRLRRTAAAALLAS